MFYKSPTFTLRSYAKDIYPFGSLIPGRTGNSPAYRYGFQGQEKDDELKGDGNSLNYTFRMHDPRVGRFFAIDPLARDYPWNSPYAFSENRVVDAIELEGLEKIYYMQSQRNQYEGLDKALKILNKAGIIQELAKKFELNNNKTDLYMSVVRGLGTTNGDTARYDNYDNSNAGKGLAMDDIREDNPQLPISSILENTISKGKQTIINRLNEDLVTNAANDPTALKQLALTITHEIFAHSLDEKDLKDDIPTEKEHEDFHNDKKYNGMKSAPYNEVKKDSPAGKFKERIEKAYNDLYEKKDDKKNTSSKK